MTPDAVNDAAGLLARHRVGAIADRPQLDGLPSTCRPDTLDDAYAIQKATRRLLEAGSSGRQIGWKIGCTTPVMQDYLNIPHPCAGTLYANRFHRNAARLKHGDHHQLGLECEIAVTLRSDLIPAAKLPFDKTRVSSAIGWVMASIEIVEHRFADFTTVGTATLVADDFFSVGCIVGTPVDAADVADLAALEGGFKIDGKAASERGTGAAILGDPLEALAWLANHAADRGTPLRGGQTITLGSLVKTIYPEPGMVIETGIGGLPGARVSVG